MNSETKKRLTIALSLWRTENNGIQSLIRNNESDNMAIIASLLTSVSGNERRSKVPRIENYAEVTVPSHSPDDFKSHFRLSRCTFELFVNDLKKCPEFEIAVQGSGRPPIEISKQAMVFLWIIGTQDTYRSIADRFGISKSTTHAICHRVTQAVVEYMMGETISWPSHERRKQISDGFEIYCEFPNVIGSIDGCHIRIRAPKKEDNPTAYINRKKYHSIVLQAVCDHELNFTHVYAGWPGCTHDARVLKNCDLYNQPDLYYDQGQFLLGDSAYPVLPWLITPYRDFGNLNAKKKKFNKSLGSARVAIERAFGQLKGRFRRLRDLDCLDSKLICFIILSSCVMHNFCISNADVLTEDTDEEGDVNDDLPVPYHDLVDGSQKRDDLATMLARD